MKNIIKKIFKRRKYIDINRVPDDPTYQLLSHLHKKINPKTYLEIGVNQGNSIVQVQAETNAIGIDPFDSIMYKLPKNIKIYFETSDAFFERPDISEILNNKKIDLAFIDGMHLFEYVLRDFINVEKLVHKNTIIALHDCIPSDSYMTTREFHSGSWTGDVFKMIMVLKKYRPDLKIYNFNSLCVVINVNPQNKVLQENYDRIVDEYMNIAFDDIAANKEEILSVIDKSVEEIKEDINSLILEMDARTLPV